MSSIGRNDRVGATRDSRDDSPVESERVSVHPWLEFKRRVILDFGGGQSTQKTQGYKPGWKCNLSQQTLSISPEQSKTRFEHSLPILTP